MGAVPRGQYPSDSLPPPASEFRSRPREVISTDSSGGCGRDF